jgi:hypothetical protein
VQGPDYYGSLLMHSFIHSRFLAVNEDESKWDVNEDEM